MPWTAERAVRQASLKAWTGHQALHAARANAAGREDLAEALLVDVIVRETRNELESALPEARTLADSLTRQLRIIAELSGLGTLSLPGKRKDAKTTRQISARLLEAIEPLDEALHPARSPLEAPDILCAPDATDLGPYLRILRWFLEDGESLRVLALADQHDPFSALVDAAKAKVSMTFDRAAAKTLVVVKDRRIIAARADTFLARGEIRRDIPVELVRFARVATNENGGASSSVDLITRDENIRWVFDAEIDNIWVEALAAVLGESMTIPDEDREQLQRRRCVVVEAAEEGGAPDTESPGTVRALATAVAETPELRCPERREPVVES